MAMLDRIKYDGEPYGESWLVHKYPSEQFVLGSQLIVNQSQEALFFKGGQALDLFGPGTHTISSGNIPILHKLVNLPFGGKTPFSAEIYYINMTSRLDMKWGTSVPFQVKDPLYQIILGVRAFGQYGVTIKDARLFVSKIIGAVHGGNVSDYQVIRSYFNGLINTKIKEIISSYILHKNISLLDITTYLGELSEVCQNAINEEFNRFGVGIVNFFVESINFPNDDIEKLKDALARKSELNVLGEDYYRQRSFDVFDKLAANEGNSGLAEAGMGLGMGLGAAPFAGQAFANMAGNINTAPQANRTEATKSCSKCNTLNSANSMFCTNCGESLQVKNQCHACHEEIPEGSKFCGHCGQPQGYKKCSNCGHQNMAANAFCEECGNKC